MGKISKLAKFVLTPGSLIKALKEIEMEEPPTTEAEKELSAYSWAGVVGLEVGRVALYLALPFQYYINHQ